MHSGRYSCSEIGSHMTNPMTTAVMFPDASPVVQRCDGRKTIRTDFSAAEFERHERLCVRTKLTRRCTRRGYQHSSGECSGLFVSITQLSLTPSPGARGTPCWGWWRCRSSGVWWGSSGPPGAGCCAPWSCLCRRLRGRGEGVAEEVVNLAWQYSNKSIAGNYWSGRKIRKDCTKFYFSFTPYMLTANIQDHKKILTLLDVRAKSITLKIP